VLLANRLGVLPSNRILQGLSLVELPPISQHNPPQVFLARLHNNNQLEDYLERRQVRILSSVVVVGHLEQMQLPLKRQAVSSELLLLVVLNNSLLQVAYLEVVSVLDNRILGVSSDSHNKLNPQACFH
jgi:hypothetical protein